jgi:peptidoglycan/xylan/chitin deacetylase (PgdA/CDA1 family)
MPNLSHTSAKITIVCSDNWPANAVIGEIADKFPRLISRVIICPQVRSAEKAFSMLLGKSFHFILYKFFVETLLPKLRSSSGGIYAVCRRHGIKVQKINSLGSNACRSAFEGGEYLFSLYCAQVLPPEILSRYEYALNCHGSLLPDYRGIAPYFWAVKESAERAGITIHFMSPELDCGDIVVRRDFAVSPKDTVYSVHQKSIESAKNAVSEIFENIETGSIPAASGKCPAGRRYYMPSSKDYREFRAEGKQLFLIEELFRDMKKCSFAAQALTALTGAYPSAICCAVEGGELEKLAAALCAPPQGIIEKIARLGIASLVRKLPGKMRARIMDVIKKIRNPSGRVNFIAAGELPGNKIIKRLLKAPRYELFYGGRNGVLCLTHDIDNAAGAEFAPALAETEKKLGLRSSFNFLTHADYEVPRSFIRDLRVEGFEAGLHGFDHDISLAYRSRAFIKDRISRAVEALGFVPAGFRSPALSASEKLFDVLEETGFQYDSSLPANCGFYASAGMNFPFLLKGRGLVELPLAAQDDMFFRDANAGESAAMEAIENSLRDCASFGGVFTLNIHPHLMQARIQFYPALLDRVLRLCEELSMRVMLPSALCGVFRNKTLGREADKKL